MKVWKEIEISEKAIQKMLDSLTPYGKSKLKEKIPTVTGRMKKIKA